MPYVNKERPYKKEYANETEERKKQRAKRNNARRKMKRKGLVTTGDGKDVDHKTPLSKGGSNSDSNLRAVPAKKNRSYKRNSDHSVKG